jgi:hypothetical protein
VAMVVDSQKAQKAAAYMLVWKSNMSATERRVRQIKKNISERARSKAQTPEYRAAKNSRFYSHHSAEMRARSEEYRESLSVAQLGRIQEMARKRANSYTVAQLCERFDLSVEDYVQVISSGCAICGTHSGRMCLDHDHTNGKLRGCLCLRCNSALGMLRDNPTLFERAIQYLSRNLSSQLQG